MAGVGARSRITLAEARVGNELSRRGLLSAAVLAGSATIGAAALAGCADRDPRRSSKQGGQTTGTLRVAHSPWISGGAPWLFTDLKAAFEAQNPGLTVKFSPLVDPQSAPTAIVQKYALEARRGIASADVLLGPVSWTALAPMARAGALLPLDDVVPHAFLDRLLPASRAEAVMPDGKRYGVPYWSDVIGFLTRTDLLTRYDIPAPQSWHELVDTAKTLAKVLPDGTYAFSADYTQPVRLFLPILVTLTDKPFAENGTLDIGSAAALEALELMKQLVSFMPPGSDQRDAALRSLQAGKVAMGTFWQGTYKQTLNGKLTPDQLSYRPNLSGRHPGTVYWNTSAMVLAHSPMPEMAVKFITEALYSDLALKKSVEQSGRFAPVADMARRVQMPAWLKTAFQQLDTASVLPGNDAFLRVENTAFTEQVGRMILRGQSAADTQKALTATFKTYRW
ncbi:ABC transporter substrate-binding protein [Kribbella sp. CA-294648]|uniref:ABC transporter substrate-binding protein n=1 Tax=Kribbella sp. CA-294648 TaxID=3239948 RepID=UPI003D8B7C05